jgi:hypothetical protein
MDGRRSRRTVLTALAATTAGCFGGDGSEEGGRSGPDVSATETTPTAETDASRRTANDSEIVKSFTVQPTRVAETVSIEVSLSGDVELSSLELSTESDSTTTQLSGTSASTEATLSAPPMRMSRVTATVQTSAGEAVATRQTYARKHDVLEDPSVNVGGLYQPYMGNLIRQDCMDDTHFEPEFDWKMTDPLTVNGQIDYMQGFGVTQIQHVYNGGSENETLIEQWMDHQLSDRIALEGNLDTPKFWKWKKDLTFREKLQQSLEWYAANYLGRENVRTTADGRPIVRLYGAGFLAWDDESREYIMDEWGNYEAFVDHLRDLLAVGDTKPYLIGQTPKAVGVGDDNFEQYFQHFEAVTTWTQDAHNVEGGWNALLERTAEDFELTRAYADEHDLAFVPVVFPGFDDRHNDCWGSDRHLERSVDRFGSFLDLALEYATDDLNEIHVATWSAWAEGTQIEPGSFRGEDYGTGYIEAIRERQ